jgi:cytochrome c peroxidase
VGGHIFEDENLSLRRNQSCASCHDPAWGFTSPNEATSAAGAVMEGSVSGRFGIRKAPSAAYATMSPVMHFDAARDAYVGGSFWDGRAVGLRLGNPAAEQAEAPFLDPLEQGLPDAACVVYRISTSSYASVYAAAWGSAITRIAFPPNTDALCTQEHATVPLSAEDRALARAAFDRVALSIVEFEASSEVSAFSSRYDAYLAGRATLTSEESRGLALYEGAGKCASCHPNAGARALFTNYTYANIGTPSNPRNPALVADASYRDSGLGGMLRDSTRWGHQKVPTLRNVDRRGSPGAVKAYMHNGAFKSLSEVVHFHNTRDVLGDCASIPGARPGVNCWPAPEVPANVTRGAVGDLGLSADDELALVAYLRTLSDGYFVPAKAAR